MTRSASNSNISTSIWARLAVRRVRFAVPTRASLCSADQDHPERLSVFHRKPDPRRRQLQVQLVILQAAPSARRLRVSSVLSNAGNSIQARNALRYDAANVSGAIPGAENSAHVASREVFPPSRVGASPQMARSVISVRCKDMSEVEVKADSKANAEFGRD